MKAARYFFVIVLALVLTSCEFEETDLGFPQSITFTSNGGEKTITGDESFLSKELKMVNFIMYMIGLGWNMLN